MIYVIVGPTGVGKTKLSVELAKRINAEIINCDSMQFFKGLDIGTAKVTEEEKEGIPHHLFDIKEVEEDYSIYDYQKDLRKKIKELEDLGKKIIIVGGSGLYIKAGLFDYNFTETNNTYNFDNLTNEDLLNKIKTFDNTCDIHLNNRKRLERYLTKLLNNDLSLDNGNIPLYDFMLLGLTTDRENLYNIIDKRVDKMFEEGLEKEVKYYYDKKIKSKAIKTGIGYKELYKYFDKEIEEEEAKELIKKNSRHYAKRQYTFFNNQFDIKWFNTNYEDFNKTVDEVYEYIKYNL